MANVWFFFKHKVDRCEPSWRKIDFDLSTHVWKALKKRGGGGGRGGTYGTEGFINRAEKKDLRLVGYWRFVCGLIVVVVVVVRSCKTLYTLQQLAAESTTEWRLKTMTELKTHTHTFACACVKRWQIRLCEHCERANQLLSSSNFKRDTRGKMNR